MADTYLIVSAIITIIAILTIAYTVGALDPVIKQIGTMLFKMKAKAEEKKLQAQGMKEGEDFLAGQIDIPLAAVPCRRNSSELNLLLISNAGELRGNQQANNFKRGLGGIGGLKMGL
jgi:uncharacterized ion transporter superfamily protein YfcC